MEQTITTAIEQAKTCLKDQQLLSPECEQQVSNLRKSFQSFEGFAIQYNPDTQVILAADERKAIMDSYSTLDMLDMAFGVNSASSWLVPAINDINMFTGSKNMTDEQVEKLAYLLAQEYKNIKISVFQLFFYKFKCGYFGKFYGKVDPMVITCALKDFVDDCETKRQQYLTEEYELRKAEEDAEREQSLKQWDACLDDLLKSSPDEDGKQLFGDIRFLTFDKGSNTLLLKLRRQSYELLEGKYLRVFSSIINKHYPNVNVRYSIIRESVVTIDASAKKEAELVARRQREVQQGITSAHAVIDNKFRFVENTLEGMRYAFKLRYKHEPEEYLKNQKKDV